MRLAWSLSKAQKLPNDLAPFEFANTRHVLTRRAAIRARASPVVSRLSLLHCCQQPRWEHVQCHLCEMLQTFHILYIRYTDLRVPVYPSPKGNQTGKRTACALLLDYYTYGTQRMKTVMAMRTARFELRLRFRSCCMLERNYTREDAIAAEATEYTHVSSHISHLIQHSQSSLN